MVRTGIITMRGMGTIIMPGTDVTTGAGKGLIMTEGTPIITETGHCIITPSTQGTGMPMMDTVTSTPMSTRITMTTAMDMPMVTVTTNLRPVTGTTKRLPRRMSPTVTDRSPPFLRPAPMCATIAASRTHPLSTA